MQKTLNEKKKTRLEELLEKRNILYKDLMKEIKRLNNIKIEKINEYNKAVYIIDQDIKKESKHKTRVKK